MDSKRVLYRLANALVYLELVGGKGAMRLQMPYVNSVVGDDKAVSRRETVMQHITVSEALGLVCLVSTMKRLEIIDSRERYKIIDVMHRWM